MKKYWIWIGLLALLAAAIYINATTNKRAAETAAPTPGIRIESEPVEETAAEEEDYFAAFRENRENTREKELEYLSAIITFEETDAETLADAQQQQMEIVACMETEFTVESLLRAKGFTDAAVTYHRGSVNVVLDAAALDEQQAAQVLDIVCRETGESAEHVKITAAG